MLGEAPFGLLREDEGAVGDDVELGLRSGNRFGVVAVRVELRREAHGPRVVAVSDGAVEDLDTRHAVTLVCRHADLVRQSLRPKRLNRRFRFTASVEAAGQGATRGLGGPCSRTFPP